MDNPKTHRFFFTLIFSSAVVVLPFILTALKPADESGIADNILILDSKQLDANNIGTWFRNNGSFNYQQSQGIAGFEWPRGAGKYARFASGVWIGARVGDDTLVTIAEYSSAFKPGFTDSSGVPRGQDDPLYKIYKLYLGVNNPDRANWPNALVGNSNQGAPVYFDTRLNRWLPLDFGHQTLFYRFTDSYGRTPLKADVISLDFAVDIPGGLNDVTFSQFTVINKSTNTWTNAFITIWTDDDLGYAVDDKVGCDSALNLGYTYNGTNNDAVYGEAPPAVGFLVLRGVLLPTRNNNDTVYICRNKTRIPLIGYKDLKMSVFNSYRNSNDTCAGNPGIAREWYRYMSGYSRCGQPIIHPNGYATKYIYSGDPVTGQGWIQSFMDDQRFMISSGPVSMNPGDTQVIVVAQVIARGTSNLNSITRLRQLTAVVKNYYNTCYTSPPVGIEPISSEVPTEFKLYQNYPNPFNPVTKIKFDIPTSPLNERGAGGFISLKLYDALGREVATLINEELKPGTYNIQWDATNFPSGIYFYSLSAGNLSESKKMILVK